MYTLIKQPECKCAEHTFCYCFCLLYVLKLLNLYLTFVKTTPETLTHISSSRDNSFSWEYVLSSKRDKTREEATRTRRNVNIS